MARKDKHRNARSDGKKDAGPQQDAPQAVVGCSVPDPITCTIGKPLAPSEEGVLMVCSNDKCPYKGKMCHEQCFAAYEDHLIRILSNMGSARGWTDAQRRANLWEKKGQSLIAKTCRCRCGLGTTRRDMEYLYSIAARTADPQPNKKKAKKGKQLPELNFPMQRKPVNNLRDTGAKPKFGGRQRTESGTSSLDEAYTYKREDHTYTAAHYEPKAYDGTHVSSGFNADYEDYNSVSDVFSEPYVPPVQKVLEPAPLPPKQTRSYASATKSASDLTPKEEEHDSGHESRSPSSTATPPTVKAKKENKRISSEHTAVDSEVTAIPQVDAQVHSTPSRPVENGRRHEQKPLKLSIFENDDTVGEEKEVLINGHIIVDNVEEEQEEEEEEPLSNETDEVIVDEEGKAEHRQILDPTLFMDPEILEFETLLPVEYIPDWEPLVGRGFDLAEMVFANHRLPGLLLEVA